MSSTLSHGLILLIATLVQVIKISGKDCKKIRGDKKRKEYQREKNEKTF